MVTKFASAAALALLAATNSASALSPAPRLGDVGRTTVSGTVSEGVRTPFTLNANENIYGPFEAGFASQQDFILVGLGCTDGADGHVPGGIDTYTAEQMVAQQCGIELPRTDNGLRISLLDSCGGHTREYHFHERMRCLYEDAVGSTHSVQIGKGSDGKFLYGKWEDFSTEELPQLDACGGHWGYTPDSPTEKVYHYHVQSQAPFTFGCYGPNDDGSLVTVQQCRAAYSGCGDGDTMSITTKDGTFDYDPWCPCYDGNGSNVNTEPLAVFASGSTAGSDGSAGGNGDSDPADPDAAGNDDSAGAGNQDAGGNDATGASDAGNVVGADDAGNSATADTAATGSHDNSAMHRPPALIFCAAAVVSVALALVA